MSITIMIRDEMAGGQKVNELSLEFLTDKITVRELIRRRIFEEVTDCNAANAQPSLFRGLIQPDAVQARQSSTGRDRMRKIDWEVQFERALDGFTRNEIFVLVDDRQMESLDDVIEIKTDTQVTFVKLLPLQGG